MPDENGASVRITPSAIYELLLRVKDDVAETRMRGVQAAAEIERARTEAARALEVTREMLAKEVEATRLTTVRDLEDLRGRVKVLEFRFFGVVAGLIAATSALVWKVLA
jgi:hypothetical protein